MNSIVNIKQQPHRYLANLELSLASSNEADEADDDIDDDEGVNDDVDDDNNDGPETLKCVMNQIIIFMMQ